MANTSAPLSDTDRPQSGALPAARDSAAPEGVAEAGTGPGVDPEETDVNRNQAEGLTTQGGVDGGVVSGSVPAPDQPLKYPPRTSGDG